MPILTAEERLGQLVAERYRLEQVLSVGGMSVLFTALDETSGRRVAVKMLKPAYALESNRVARFVRETKIASSLRHPNITEVFDVGVDGVNVPFLVMELLRGRSLEQELEERGVLSMSEVLAIMLPIADALSAAHDAGVIHRDVKPGNIFLHDDGSGTVAPRLLDFGIAKNFEDEFETQTGLTVGTPAYMAPEQAQHRECGLSTDVWAVGAVIYRCLSGSPPHTASSVPELLAKLLREPVPPISAPSLSKRACATIDRALARDPGHRYPSIAAFARALAASCAASPGRDSTDEMPAVPDSEPRLASVESQLTDEMPAIISAETEVIDARAAAPESAPPRGGRPASRWRSAGVTSIAGAALGFVLSLAIVQLGRERGASPAAGRRPELAQAAPNSSARATSALGATGRAPAVSSSRPTPTSQATRSDAKPTDPPKTTQSRTSVPASRQRSPKGAPPSAAPPPETASPAPSPDGTRAPASHPEYDKTTGLPVATEW